MTYLRATALTLDGKDGSDEINLDVHLPTLGVAFQVEGGVLAAGNDTLTVTGVDGVNDLPVWTPSAMDAGVLTLSGQAPIRATGIEHLRYDGQSDDEDLTVSGAGDFVHISGMAPDAGRVNLTSDGAAFLTIQYANLGSGGRVTAAGTGTADSLTARGTETADRIDVAFTGPNAIDVDLASGYGLHVDLRSTGVERFFIDGAQNGSDDIFLNTPVNAAAAFEVNGGGETDRLHLLADGSIMAVMLRPRPGVSGGGEVQGFGTPTICFSQLDAHRPARAHELPEPGGRWRPAFECRRRRRPDYRQGRRTRLADGRGQRRCGQRSADRGPHR